MNVSLKRNIKRLYLINILSNAQFHLVVYTLFLLSKGFSTQQFFLIESAYYLIALLMEIPTGVFSDKKSRKWSLVMASVIGIPIVPIIILSDSFVLVLVAMSIGGISSALVSGTDTAILYDTLKALNQEDDFKRISGRMGWYTSLSMALAGVIGGLIAQVDMAYAWWAFFGAGILALFAKLTLQEPPFFREPQAEESYLQHLGKSLRMSFTGDAAYFVLYAAIIWLFFSLGFIFIFVQAAATGLFSPLLGDYVNKRIPSSKRATVLSIKNMVNSVLFMTLSPLVGHFVDLYSLPTALLLMGMALVATALIFFFAYQKRGEMAYQGAQ